MKYPSKIPFKGSYRQFCSQSLMKVKNQTSRYQKNTETKKTRLNTFKCSKILLFKLFLTALFNQELEVGLYLTMEKVGVHKEGFLSEPSGRYQSFKYITIR